MRVRWEQLSIIGAVVFFLGMWAGGAVKDDGLLWRVFHPEQNRVVLDREGCIVTAYISTRLGRDLLWDSGSSGIYCFSTPLDAESAFRLVGDTLQRRRRVRYRIEQYGLTHRSAQEALTSENSDQWRRYGQDWYKHLERGE